MLCQQESEKLELFLDSCDDGFFYLSHASILVRLSGYTFLFDPVLAEPPHFGSWLFYPLMHYADRLRDVDYCIVSHQHKDHFDINFLRLLSKDTQLLIVSGRPQLEDLLDKAGISYKLLPELEVINFIDDISMYCVNHESNGIDSAMCIRNSQLSIYHGNDCYLSIEKTNCIRKNFGHIDIACIPFAYIHWYPFLVNNISEKDKELESSRLVSSYMDLALDMIRCLEPSITIPFGANMFYSDGVDTDHNKCVLNPLDFKDYAEKNAKDIASSILPLFAGAHIFRNSIDSKSYLKVVDGLLSREELLSGFTNYLSDMKLNNKLHSPLSSIKPLSSSEIISFLKIRMSRAFEVLPKLNHYIFISSTENQNYILQISLNDLDVSISELSYSSISFHHFILTPIAFNAFCSGQFSLNEFVAASMFTLTREPNIYNQEALKYVNNFI